MKLYVPLFFSFLFSILNLIQVLVAGQTLGWWDRVPGPIGAVIIDHVVHPDPLVPSILDGGEGLVGRSFPPIGLVGHAIGRTGDRATFNIKVLVVSQKWSLAPINLLKSTSSGPIISLPKC